MKILKLNGKVLSIMNQKIAGFIFGNRFYFFLFDGCGKVRAARIKKDGFLRGI
jgi:hypothetical protein